ncbi:Crp/Fnr family transcriptional regulator [Desulfovibrio inopinatus]|uniref:Crp/Fnr family transcriptional regulator n=1 Tax=Desulfovibrio inopinatus TaxID=102109 RepID=UPI0004257982|nr:Crp/Fnr family transcriptional regulator [Desulfovibrio inopinatus]
MRLTESNLLISLEAPEMQVVRQLFRSQIYHKGALVSEPKSASNRMFIVRQGRARIYLASRDKEFTVALLDAGDVYTTHTRAYVQALDDLELLVADVEMVRHHLASTPQLTMAMIRVLGDLLSHAFSAIDTLAFKDVRHRLIEFLAYEAKRQSPCKECQTCGKCQNGHMVSLGLNTEQIATILGSTRQTVSSLINTLAKDGFLQQKGRGILCIPDLTALEAEKPD